MTQMYRSPRLPAGRMIRALPLVTLALCFILSGTVLCMDIFSIVYANPSGVSLLTGGNVTVDVSNASQGYIMIRHNGSQKRLKVRMTCGSNQLQYDLNGQGQYEAFPLQFGSGQYQIEVFENAKNNDYARVYNTTYTANIPNPNAAFLSPNQYVWYTPSTEAVSKSFEICSGLTTEMERAQALYTFVGDTVMYDYMKALTVQSQKGYLPDVDDTLNTQMGICFDYAALLACMMRVQGIPCKLVIGNLISQNQYHAWNEAYINGQWILMDATFKNSNYSVSNYAQERFY